jgi:3',5'-cyclic AMP phosphodiesterase CpdA
MADTLLQFIHITDTHILKPGQTHDFTDVEPEWEIFAQQVVALPYDTRTATAAMVREINALPVRVDFILHTGDVFNDPTSLDDYRDAAEFFSPLKYPVHYIPGNHDDTAGLQTVLLGRDLSEPFDYQFESNGVQIVCLDSNDKTGQYPKHSGWLDDDQLARLDAICTANDTRPLVIAIHHPPFLTDSAPLDYLRLYNADALHQTLLKAHDRLRGVFCGHIHHPVDVVRDGILYSSGASAWYQFAAWPDYHIGSLIAGANPGFSLVTLTSDRVLVRRHTYPV